ncbi:PBP1A family penicillin-binding protein [Uliginosibacterium sp. H3]|uniref:PBP1A family penicillin-binding protein n=1 Tax=Uliginosibacterium silvisoli TaxID=3114758 RepID=A0ABU6K179_9RHOO|nr:PBP1A family penicillin-binding protein [Uliginosibacterium sp. H3]
MNPSVRAFLRQTLRVTLAAAFTVCAIAVVYVLVLIPGLPGVDQLHEARNAQPSVLLALDGTPIASFSQKQQKRVTLAEVSPHVVAALLATEDRRFYDHHGLDLRRTVSAVGHTLTGDMQGGSTITQQLARNLFPEEIGRARTLNRKVRELITALRIERAYTKDQILETYLNTVPFLYNVVGIEMAAHTYYDKPAADLDVLESATLIGMLKGASYYNPVTNPERAQRRRNVVLGQMVKYDSLPAADRAVMKDKPLNIRFSRPNDITGVAPHFATHVRKWLVEWADQQDLNLYRDGLVIQTTIDLRLQEAATNAVERQAQALQAIADVEWSQSATPQSSATASYVSMRRKVEPFRHFWRTHPELQAAFLRETPEYRQAIADGATPAAAIETLSRDDKLLAAVRAGKTRLEAGFLAMDPRSGEVRAWVGSRDFSTDQYDHVIQAERQPGSTFKPFVYGAALERGMTPDRQYEDKTIEYRAVDGSVWRPTDMDGSTGEQMSLREGLIHSKNTITAQVMQDVGVQSVVRLAQSLGVNQSKLDPVPSLALGTSPVTLMEMVTAYSTIADQGKYHKPVFIRSIADRHGKVLAEFGHPAGSTGDAGTGTQVMSQNAALELIDMMRGVVNRGTGTAVKTRFGVVADIAGKTGTTQNNTDGWFILMHPDLVAGAWVGFNDQRVTMRSNYWGQGGHNAILIVGDFFSNSMKRRIVDAKAQFPAAPSSSLLARYEVQQQDWENEAGAVVDGTPPADTATHAPANVIIRGDANGVVIENVRDGNVSVTPVGEPRPARSAEELEKVLGGMGRDPASGANAPAPRPAATPANMPASVPRIETRPAARTDGVTLRSVAWVLQA